MKKFCQKTSLLAVALFAGFGLTACGGGSSVPAPLAAPALTFTPAQESLDLNNYTLVGKYSLPQGTGANLLGAEVSAVTYNPVTDLSLIHISEPTRPY